MPLAALGLGALLLAWLVHRGGPARAERAGRPAGASSGRWLVSPSGAPPSIAAENRGPGTVGWRLAGRGTDRHALEGYVSSQDVRPGQVERVYARARGARWVRADVYRMGWYGGRGGRLVFASRRLAAAAQPPCHHAEATGLTECRWRPTLAVRIPRALPSGVYVVKLSDDRRRQRDCLFVLEAARPARLLAQIPIATYEAYNGWGGDSLYPGTRPVAATGSRQGVEVSFDRPYDGPTGAGEFLQADVAMVRFLERRGYPVSYTTNPSIDRRPRQLLGARAVLDVGHSEYWSARDEAAFRQARDGGTGLAFLSSDTLAWRVRFAPATAASSERGAPAHRIVAYKEHAARDPGRREPSGAFADGGAALTASAYEKCITPRLPGRVPPTYRYYAWRPDPRLAPGWLYRATGLRAGDRVPGIVGYELDRVTAATPPGTRVVGRGSAPCMGGVANGTADSTLYRARSGALVFATGTLGWELGLSPVPGASPDAPRRPDPRLARLTENVLDEMLHGRG